MEIGIMIAGLLINLVLGWLSLYFGTVLAGERLLRRENPIETLRGLRTLEALLLWFGPVNLLVGLFNLLPSYPLDGGRLLWAILWRITGDRHRAAKLAAQTGRAVGVVIMLAGIAMILGLRVRYVGGGFVVGLWTLFIGLFLHRAAAIGYLGPSD
jgi:Zn-dependent protease